MGTRTLRPEVAKERVLRILVVDNSTGVINNARTSLSDNARYLVRSAIDRPSAEKLLADDVFDVCFIDMRLAENLTNGLDVARTASRLQPQARLILMSRHFGANFDLVLKASEFGKLVVKSPQFTFKSEAEELLSDLEAHSIRCDGMNDILDDLLSKISRWPSRPKDRDVLAAELYRVLSNMFGNLHFLDSDSAVALKVVRVFNSGKSSSSVVEIQVVIGTDSDGHSVLGARCVLKVGYIQKICDETERFERVARFGIPRVARTELLAKARCGHIAAACYAMAGGTATDLVSAQELIDEDLADLGRELRPRLSKAFRSTFNTVLWPGDPHSGTPEPIGEFFDHQVGYDFIGESAKTRAALATSTQAYSGAIVDSELGGMTLPMLSFGSGVEFLIPAGVLLGHDALSTMIEPRLVHGDLHGGNLILSGEDVFPIDYARSFHGPMWIDQAALNGTVRFGDARRLRESKHLVSMLMQIAVEEDQVICQAIGEDDASWQGLARLIDQASDTRRAGSAEQIATYALHAASLLTYPNDVFVRLRVLVWFDALVRAAVPQLGPRNT